MITLKLFSRNECHLCDQAELLINEVLAEYEGHNNFVIKKIDIENDAILKEKYGLIIPIVLRTDSQKELGWPFPKSRLRIFLETGKLF